MNVKRMELYVSGILRLGVALSGLIITLGLAILFITGDTSCPNGILTFDWIIHGAPFLQSSHIMFIGFLILVGTPLIRVGSSVAGYWMEHDWIYVVITGTVLIVLISSITLGLG